MSEIEQLEQRIKSLPPQDLAKFRVWFVEFDAQVPPSKASHPCTGNCGA